MRQLTGQEKLHLKKIIKELKNKRAAHTEFVSVYIPAGYELTKIIQHLAEEQGTASNIKSASTRKNVQASLEKMIQHLRTVGRTPDNGLAVFSGNVASLEGKQDMQVWSIEPPMPLNIRIYRCDKTFVIDILEEMLLDKQVYGLVVLDRRDGALALLKGKTIVPVKKTHSEVPGKFKAGGQCLRKDTLVQLSSGDITQIKDLQTDTLVKSMKGKKLIDSKVTKKWKSTKDPVYTLTTKFPQTQISASKDHIFFVVNKEGISEVPVEQLKKGDTLLIPENIKTKPQPQKWLAKQYYNSFTITKKGQQLLKRKRKAKKWLQKDLAQKINVTQTTISSFEIGKLNADRTTLEKVCTALDINFLKFLVENTTIAKKTIQLPARMTPKFAQFLGYLIGDGSIETDRITFFEQREDVVRELKKQFDQLLGNDASYRFRESKNYHQLRYTSRPLVRLIQSEFSEIKKATDTLIPSKILKENNKILAGFLRGLFDAEGYVSTRKQVALGINNKLLAQQVQLALLRFSVISSLHQYDNKGNPYSKNTRYTIDITEGRSLELFKKHINFTAKEKEETLNKILQEKTVKSNVRQILVSGSKIRQTLEKAGYKIKNFPKVSNFFRDERMMSKEVFSKSILAKIKDKKLKKELESIKKIPFLPVKIEKIVIAKKKEELVDISVEQENFIANGIIVHNSAQRFARQREGAVKEHFKKIADHMKEQFLPFGNDLKGIIIGGPGITVTDFINKDYLTGDLKRKIIGTKDLSYTGDFGLQELLDRSEDLLAQEEVAQEKKVMLDFLTMLRDDPSKATYGEKETRRALQMGAVDTLLLSEELADETITQLDELAQETGTIVKIISTETREGTQLKDLSGVAAILRFPLA